MISLIKRIVEKLDHLPEPDLREVLSFVEFLSWKSKDEDEPLLSIAGILSGKMPSVEEIERDLYGDGV